MIKKTFLLQGPSQIELFLLEKIFENGKNYCKKYEKKNDKNDEKKVNFNTDWKKKGRKQRFLFSICVEINKKITKNHQKLMKKMCFFNKFNTKCFQKTLKTIENFTKNPT